MVKIAIDDLKQRLRHYDSKEYFYGRNFDSPVKNAYPFIEREAAVLVLLTMINEEIHVVLTIRSNHVRTHQGEVAFAGGVREPNDISPVETALREALEEIGLPPQLVEVLATLPPIVSRNKILLFPIIAFMKNFQAFTPSPNPQEVSKCFHIPLERFLSKEGLTEREYFLEPAKKKLKSYFFEDRLSDGDTVATFGITGFICILVASALYRRKPDYPFFLPFPDDDNELAWKQAFVDFGLRYKDVLNVDNNKKVNVTSKV